jgi:Kinesin-like protein
VRNKNSRTILFFPLHSPDSLLLARVEYSIKASYLEIYKEKVRDLLNPKNKDLKIKCVRIPPLSLFTFLIVDIVLTINVERTKARACGSKDLLRNLSAVRRTFLK